MKPQKVMIYARISGIEIQNNLSAQIKCCEQYCKDNEMTISSTFEVEGSTDRSFPELLKTIKNSTEKITVVVTTYDRIASQDFECKLLKELEQQGRIEIKEVLGRTEKICHSDTEKLPNEVYLELTPEVLNEISEEEIGRELTQDEMKKIEATVIESGAWTEFIHCSVKQTLIDLYAENE